MNNFSPPSSIWAKIFFFLFLILAQNSYSQQNENVVEAWDQYGFGFYLKKVVSNTTICSGQTFSYTIYFSLPAGTQNATITDILPPSLVFHSVSVTNACGTPIVNSPAPGTNGTVSVQFNSVPSAGCSGSFTIVVSFPNGTTCNNTSARNNVCIYALYYNQDSNETTQLEFCTESVSTTAQASNTWKIEKQILNGNWQGGPCPWKFYGDTVTYRICVYKNNPAPCGTNGQLNLVNGVVQDILPAGAQFISANSSSVTSSGNVITWNVGNLSATIPYNKVCVDIKVYYPPSSFPNNSQITNSATLTGQLGSLNQPCGSFTQTDSVCWQKSLPPPPTTSGSLYKWVSTNGQPGCGGTYYILFCNTGNTTLSANSVVIRDTLPATLVLNSATSWSNVTTSTSGNIVTATLNSPLQPGNCTYITINYTIATSAIPNTTITNCAYAFVQGLAPLTSCASFVVNAPTPKACIQKQICNQQNFYSIGQTIRFRLRIQNIGGQSISGATITDNLDPNFQYIGNPSFYQSNTLINCYPTSGTTAWTPAPTISVSGQTITISNINIPASCQNLFWSGCGWYGNNTVPYYWVEFDVKIVDTAGLGNIPNNFTISGGGLPSPVTSNTVYTLVTGVTGFTLGKEVAQDTSNWGTTLSVPPGGMLYYQLKMPISGTVPLRNVTFVDLLPKDAGTSDNRILPNPCVARGSQFDITYNSTVLTNPASSWYKNTSSTQASPNGIAPLVLFPTSCGTNTSWVPTPSNGDKNLGIYFPTAIGPGNTPEVIFKAQASNNASGGQIACNSFAAGASVRHYLNSTTTQDIRVAPLESGNICIAIDSSSKCYGAQIKQFPTVIGQTGDGCKYRLIVSLNNTGATTLSGCATSPQGQVIPSTFNVPPGTSTLTLQFIDTPPQNDVACIYFGIQDTASGSCSVCDSVCFDLPPCPQDTCCPDKVKLDVKCKDRDSFGNQIYQICASGNIDCKAFLNLWTPDGTLSPSTFSVGPPSFSICTDFYDTPPTTGVITLYYNIIKNGLVLCSDSVIIQLPPCDSTQPDRCCSSWERTLQSSVVKWNYAGNVWISGSASASMPLQRFSATIVSAQRKIIPNILQAPPGAWQRIFGDFITGWAFNPPGPLSVLTPFSRELIWDGTCTQQVSPGNFKLSAILPPPPSSFKARDTLRFSIRYSFTDCECRTCDTLVTYTIVRPGRIIIFNPWDVVNILPLRNAVQMSIPIKSYAEDDTSFFTEITMTELHSPPGNQLTVVKAEQASTYISQDGQTVLVFPESKEEGNREERIELEIAGAYKTLVARYHYRESGGGLPELDGDGYEERTYDIPTREDEQPQAVILQDEQKIDGVRTFGLSIVNKGQVPVTGLSLVLSPLPQPDGTIPTIIAYGRPGSKEIVINHDRGSTNLDATKARLQLPNDVIDAGGTLRTLYITVSGINSDGRLDLLYEILTKDGLIVGQGTAALEGAVSGIKPIGSENDNQIPRITAIIPNPSSNNASVSIWSPIELTNARLEIYDMFGKLLNSETFTTLPAGNTVTTVNSDSHPSGTYLMVLRTNLGTTSEKWIILK